MQVQPSHLTAVELVGSTEPRAAVHRLLRVEREGVEASVHGIGRRYGHVPLRVIEHVDRRIGDRAQLFPSHPQLIRCGVNLALDYRPHVDNVGPHFIGCSELLCQVRPSATSASSGSPKRHSSRARDTAGMTTTKLPILHCPRRPRRPLISARFKGQSREHTASDLQSYLAWCETHGLDPLAATRSHIELYLRWLQEVQKYRPSTVSRRMSVLTGFYRTCVVDGVLEHSPAEYVRRPNVPPESPTLGLTHPQFEAMLSAANGSDNQCDFALVTMLGLLGPRIFEATGSDICDLGETHGHRVLRVRGEGDKVVLVPLPPAVRRAIDRSIDRRAAGPILLSSRGTHMDRHCATRRLRHLAAQAGVSLPRMHPHMRRYTVVTTMLDADVDLRDVQIAARHADPRTTMRYARARKNLDRHPICILAAYMASGT